MSRAAIVLGCGVLLGCQAQRQSGPSVLEDYRAALERGELAQAYALTSDEHRAAESFDAFRQRLSQDGARAQVIETLRAVERLESVDAVALVRQADGWRLTERSRDQRAQRALQGFLDSVRHGDFDAAYGRLSARWRARYTPESLEADFRAEPLASERLARIAAHLGRPFLWEGGEGRLPLGEGLAARLVSEGGVLRVGGLE